MIYIATHKQFDVPDLENYIPIHVGAYGKKDLGYLTDESGDSISVKNPNYCELTGLYWIWKNCDDDYKGLVHYRRYFGKNNLSNSKKKILHYDEMLGLLKNADIVLPYTEYFKQNAKDEIMIQCCTDEIFNELQRVVELKHPDYTPDFNEFFRNNEATLFNMMFCRKALFDSYCEWLFDILFELEKNVDLTPLNAYQQRLYGFLSERLLNVWVKHNGLRVVHTGVINVEMRLIDRIQLIRRRFTNRIFYRLNKNGE